MLDTSVIDEVVTVNTDEAMVNARRLAMEEGLLMGISSGANLAACLKVQNLLATHLSECLFLFLSLVIFSYRKFLHILSSNNIEISNAYLGRVERGKQGEDDCHHVPKRG